MRVLLLEAPEGMVEERRRLGLDGRDEMWDGVLHMVPPPSYAHQNMAARVFRVLAPHAETRGLEAVFETGLFRSRHDYRVPDQIYHRPDQRTDRGVVGAELVVEIRSAGDETYDKFDFYAALGVHEVFVLHPHDRSVELFRLTDSHLAPVAADPSGGLHCTALDLTLHGGGGTLRLTWPTGSAEL